MELKDTLNNSEVLSVFSVALCVTKTLKEKK